MATYTISELNKVKRGPNRAIYDIGLINNIIDSGFIAHVAYSFNGKAISIPMAYGRIGNKLYLHGSLKNRMLLSLLQAKEASLSIMHLDGLVLARSGFHHSVNYRSATLFTTVTKVEELILKEKALKCIMDYMIPNRWDTLRPMNSKEFNSTLVLELDIQTASAKVRDEGVIDEKADVNLPVWAGVIPIKQIAQTPINNLDLQDCIETPEHVTAYFLKHKA